MFIRWGRAEKMRICCWVRHNCKPLVQRFIISTGGGDITYHGPGQLVCYPILNLEDYHLGLKEYIHVLEEAVIQVCASYGIEAGRVKGATGVWLAIGTPRERKICGYGGAQQSFRYDAWTGIECQYGLALFWVYQSMRIYK